MPGQEKYQGIIIATKLILRLWLWLWQLIYMLLDEKDEKDEKDERDERVWLR
jgi:hypothetical protein